MIQTYRYCLSPLVGSSCRFYPSCSAYALESFKKFGILRALLLSVKRISRCHPGCPGGTDPVP